MKTAISVRERRLSRSVSLGGVGSRKNCKTEGTALRTRASMSSATPTEEIRAVEAIRTALVEAIDRRSRRQSKLRPLLSAVAVICIALLGVSIYGLSTEQGAHQETASPTPHGQFSSGVLARGTGWTLTGTGTECVTMTNGRPTRTCLGSRSVVAAVTHTPSALVYGVVAAAGRTGLGGCAPLAGFRSRMPQRTACPRAWVSTRCRFSTVPAER